MPRVSPSGWTADQLIEYFELKPHPEGGFYRVNYRCEETISQSALPGRFHGDRPYSSAIYYLLPAGAKSRLHQIASDELWHFYLGDPMVLVELLPDRSVRRSLLGQDLENGHLLQAVVKAGTWFGAFPASGSRYSFVGCTVAPGFDFAEFKWAERVTLLNQYPDAREFIEELL